MVRTRGAGKRGRGCILRDATPTLVAPEHPCTVDSFLWHPLSMPFERRFGGVIVNDRATIRCPEEYEAVAPPRGCEPPVRMAELSTRVENWIHNKGMRLVRQRHGIACPKTRRIMFVDLVLETSQMAPVLLCLCCSGKRVCTREMKTYMRRVQLVCNRMMGFYPQVVSLCIYGPPSNPRMYSKCVNQRPVFLDLSAQ